MKKLVKKKALKDFGKVKLYSSEGGGNTDCQANSKCCDNGQCCT